jgi:hypothetical protein
VYPARTGHGIVRAAALKVYKGFVKVASCVHSRKQVQRLRNTMPVPASITHRNKLPMATTSTRSDLPQPLLTTCISKAQSRLELWAEVIRSAGVRRIAEVGVYRGDFAAYVLKHCECLTAYYMIDPWRHLSNWNKPANHEDMLLDEFFRETKTKTDFAAGKRMILRGKTTEVIEQIPNGELDLAYIDADHTLKGIAIDLIRVYPKVRDGGFLGGDDFTRSAWEHDIGAVKP